MSYLGDDEVATNRLRSEAMRIMRDRQAYEKEGVFGAPNDDTARVWTAVIRGPKGTPYEGGYWAVEITTKGFPVRAPSATFSTKILHPNIGPSGKVCLDILGGSWTGTTRMISIIREIRALLSVPNFDDPLNIDVAKTYKELGEKEYEQKVREHTRDNAKKSSVPVYDMKEQEWVS